MEPITRIRQFIDIEPDSWVAECFRRYIHNAHDGLSLEQAFDLTTAPGEAPWWRQEAFAQRNAALRSLADKHFGNLDLKSQADGILRAARRYRTGRWRLDQDTAFDSQKYTDTRNQLLYEAFSHGYGDLPDSMRQLCRILDDTN